MLFLLRLEMHIFLNNNSKNSFYYVQSPLSTKQQKLTFLLVYYYQNKTVKFDIYHIYQFFNDCNNISKSFFVKLL